MELPEAVAVADDVLGSRRKEGERLTRNELEAASGRLASAAKRRRVLAILALADEAAESVGESRSRALIHVLGLAAPVLQHAFYDSDGFIGRTDFFWPEYGVIGRDSWGRSSQRPASHAEIPAAWTKPLGVSRGLDHKTGNSGSGEETGA
jgi:hypothetical protein